MRSLRRRSSYCGIPLVSDVKVEGVVIAHDDEGLTDLLVSLDRCAPEMGVTLYDSGLGNLGTAFGLPTVSASRPLEYAKVGNAFLDIMEWFVENTESDAWMNLETDMVFVRPGFVHWLEAILDEADYVAPRLFAVPPRSRWRPARSLRSGGRRRLLDILDADRLCGGFSPGQVFHRRFADRLVDHARYPELRKFLREQEAAGGAYSTQETVFPTAADSWGVATACYPEQAQRVNRYRPYLGPAGVRHALEVEDVYFVHPVRRNPDDPTRRLLCSTA